jgi:hypothetical protein
MCCQPTIHSLNPFCVLFSIAVAYIKVDHNRYNVEESRHSRRTFVACLLVSRLHVSIPQFDLFKKPVTAIKITGLIR